MLAFQQKHNKLLNQTKIKLTRNSYMISKFKNNLKTEPEVKLRAGNLNLDKKTKQNLSNPKFSHFISDRFNSDKLKNDPKTHHHTNKLIESTQDEEFSFGKNQQGMRGSLISPVPKKIKIKKIRSLQRDTINFLTQSEPQIPSKHSFDEQIEHKNFCGSPSKFLRWYESKQKNSKDTNSIKPLSAKLNSEILPIKKSGVQAKYQTSVKQCQFLTQLIQTNLLNKKAKLFGLIQGHGQHSKKIINYLKTHLCQKLEEKMLTEVNREKAIKCTFKKLLQGICEDDSEKLLFSGATSTFCMIEGSELYTFNIGNNRAIVGERNNYQNEWFARQISHDHIFTQETELTRILINGGKIYKAKTPNGTENCLRVWGQANGQMYGINTTRSFGDLSLSSYGVIAIPDVYSMALKTNQKIIFIGQVSIFEFLSKDEIIEICSFYYEKGFTVWEATVMIDHQLLNLVPADEWSKQDFSFILIFLNQ